MAKKTPLPETSRDVLMELDEQPTDAQAKALVQQALEDSRDYHARFVERLQARYDAYRGWLKAKSEADTWRSKYHAPQIQPVIEAITANLMDDDLTVEIEAMPQLDAPEVNEGLRLLARVLEIRLKVARNKDHRAAKQRDFVLQQSIAGITGMKSSWRTMVEPRTKRVLVDEPVFNKVTDVDPLTGEIFETEIQVGVIQKEQVVTEPVTIFDDPSAEVLNMRDVFWPESAVDEVKAPWLMHRVWMTPREIRREQKAGRFRKEKLKWDSLVAADDDPYISVEERNIFQRNRTKGLIPVYEYWTDDWLIVVAGEAGNGVLLRNTANPYWFTTLEHRKPFIFASTAPDLFAFEGISDVELVMHLQELLWTITNQRLDSLAQVANAVWVFRSDMDIDIDDLDIYPGAALEVPGNPKDAIQMIQPNPVPAEITLPAEDRVRGDIHDATGGMGMSASATSQQISQKTATGASWVMSMAQRRLAQKKQQLAWAYARQTEQELALCQQFDSFQKPRLVSMVGRNGAEQVVKLYGHMYSDLAFQVKARVMSESLNRTERRAERQAVLDSLANIVGAAQVTGTPITLKPAIIDYLKEFGEENPERFFIDPQPPAAPPGLPAGPQPGGPGLPPDEASVLGTADAPVTNADLAAGVQSPSNAASLHGGQFMQQFLAKRGGANNREVIG